MEYPRLRLCPFRVLAASEGWFVTIVITDCQLHPSGFQLANVPSHSCDEYLWAAQKDSMNPRSFQE